MKNTISAIILVGEKNDGKLLKKCLDSVSWCDEVIKVYTADLKGSFADWRNEGAKRANGDWLFYVDTDEEVTPELKKEILPVIKNYKLKIKNCAFAIPRKNILLGKQMRFGGWWPDYVLRLIKKDSLIAWKGELHEQPEIKGSASWRIGKLKEPLIHTSHRSLTEMVEKTNEWSEIEAKLLYNSGHPQMVWWRFFSVATREFWYRGIIKLGFLDGVTGIIEIIYQMFSRMVTYAKLWELQLKSKKSNKCITSIIR
jgi:glycosyltransferase involved in cell wall biosynthesis